MPDQPSSKACRICGETKPLDAFHRASGMRGGHRNECRNCFRALARARYRRDPAKAIAKVKRWQQENSERLNAYRTARRELPAVKRQGRSTYYLRTYGISADEFDRPPASARRPPSVWVASASYDPSDLHGGG